MDDLKIIGYDEDGNPIFLIVGADNDDTDDTDDSDDTDDDTDDTDDSDDDDADDADSRKHPPSGKKVAAPKAAPPKKAVRGTYTPPSEAEWRRVQAALQKLNQKEKAARTAQLEKARREGMDEAATKAREEALKEAEERYMPILIGKEAKLALAEAGCKNPARLVNLVDRSKCQVQDDGDILGLEGEINRIKEEWPELFTDPSDANTNGNGKKAPAKKAAPASKVGAADKKDDDKDKKASGASRIASRLLGTSASS